MNEVIPLPFCIATLRSTTYPEVIRRIKIVTLLRKKKKNLEENVF